MIKNINDIKNVIYINLESRPDRKEHVEKQLSTIGLQKIQRFNAVRMTNGALGCSLSHLKCLQIAKANNWDHVLICEDDIQFLDPPLFIKQLNGFLENMESWERSVALSTAKGAGERLNSVDDSRRSWDVVLLAGNNMRPYKIANEYSVKVSWSQTTTGYIVKKHYYDKLIENYITGIKHLYLEPHHHSLYAIDQFWTRLQEKDDWFLITPLTVVQRADYSDVEKKQTNYKRVMTMLDK